MMHDNVQEIPCSTAQEFLRRLSLLDENFNLRGRSGAWLFRGHGKEKWKLVPSLFRTDSTLSSFVNRTMNDYSDLLLIERDLIVQFFETADKRGLIIPDDSQELRIFFEKVKSSDEYVCVGNYRWRIKDQALSIIALAQHYGVPTRLLDWTRQPYVAAYFAAEKAFDLLKNKEANPSEQMAVWAFYFPDFGKQDEETKLNGPLSIVTVPKATNTNLKAQQGVFTLLNSMWLGDFSSKKYQEFLFDRMMKSEMEYLVDIKGEYPSLNELLGRLTKLGEDLPYPENNRPKLLKFLEDCRFQKFTLPMSEAKSLLYALSILDITPTTIYPGYQSTVYDMKMQKLWE